MRKYVEESDLIVGFSFRKCTSGKKAFIKSFLNGTQYDSEAEDESSESEKETKEIKTKNGGKTNQTVSKKTPLKEDKKAEKNNKMEIEPEKKLDEEPKPERKTLMKAKKTSKKPDPPKKARSTENNTAGSSLSKDNSKTSANQKSAFSTGNIEKEANDSSKTGYKQLSANDLSFEFSQDELDEEEEAFPLLDSQKVDPKPLEPPSTTGKKTTTRSQKGNKVVESVQKSETSLRIPSIE